MDTALLVAFSYAAAVSLEAAATPKPGNVHRQRDFPDTRFEHFLMASPPVAHCLVARLRRLLRGGGFPVGRTIYCMLSLALDFHKGGNTNLGTALLFSVLAPAAALAHREGVFPEGAPAKARLVLGWTGWRDAYWFYRAVLRARPSYLGRSPGGRIPSVFDPRFPRLLREGGVGLVEVLEYSSSWDLVSREVLSGGRYSFGEGLRYFLTMLGRGWNTAVVATYMHLLSREPDSLLVRKRGPGYARRVMEEAAAVQRLGPGTGEWWEGVRRLDRRLAAEGANPGAVADVTAGIIASALIMGRRPRVVL